MNTTHEEKKATKDLIDLCRTYLLDNFHKFSEFNKIKIALALNLKAVPTQIEGEMKVTQMPAITVDNRVKEYILGN